MAGPVATQTSAWQYLKWVAGAGAVGALCYLYFSEAAQSASAAILGDARLPQVLPTDITATVDLAAVKFGEWLTGETSCDFAAPKGSFKVKWQSDQGERCRFFKGEPSTSTGETPDSNFAPDSSFVAWKN
jgi:hypothetical protein